MLACCGLFKFFLVCCGMFLDVSVVLGCFGCCLCCFDLFRLLGCFRSCLVVARLCDAVLILLVVCVRSGLFPKIFRCLSMTCILIQDF